MDSTAVYDELAASYDQMITWPQRLQHEKKLLTAQFRAVRAERIADIACGTGEHALAFADWGYQVTAADPAEEMLAAARRKDKAKRVQWVQSDFAHAEADLLGPFDAVTCLGNSLPHVAGDRELREVLTQFWRLLRPGGVAILHTLNYAWIQDQGRIHFSPGTVRRSNVDHVLHRMYQTHGRTVDFVITDVFRRNGHFESLTSTMHHWPITGPLLQSALEAAGFTEVALFGSFADDAYAAKTSEDIIAVARRPDLGIPPSHEPQSWVDRLPIHECDEPMIDLVAAMPKLLYRQTPCCIRAGVLTLLREAFRSLPRGFTFKINQGYRSLEHQRDIYQRFRERLLKEHPDWSLRRITTANNHFVHNPAAKAPPGHCTGGAVDLTMIDRDGIELDMTSPGKWDWRNAETFSIKISQRARENRRILYEAMMGAGFSNFAGEWWHYSYGDSGWALRLDQPHAIYAAAQPTHFAKCGIKFEDADPWKKETGK